MLLILFAAKLLATLGIRLIGNQSGFETFSRSWAAFAFFSSGLPEFFFPPLSKSMVIIRIVYFFSCVAHTGPIIQTISSHKNLPNWIRFTSSKAMQPILERFGNSTILPIHIFVLLIVCTSQFRSLLPLMAFSIVPLYIWMSLVKKDSYLFCFAVCVSVECLKLLNFRFMPYGNLPLIFIFCLTLDRFFTQIVHAINEYKRKIILSAQQTVSIQIASQIAHDIRSPLASLQAVIHNAKGLDEESRALVITSASRIRDIASNLLSKNRTSESIDLLTSFEPTCDAFIPSIEAMSIELLATLIESIIAEKRALYRERHDININCSIPVEFQSLFVNLQPTEFNCILSNLINNSVEAIERTGEINILLTTADEQAILSIKDNGKGIPEHLLSKVIERGGTFGKNDGNGLGLSHAVATIKQWGGSLNLDSTIGEGTTVTLLIPIAQSPSWIASKIHVNPDSTVVTIDDDLAIGQLWLSRFNELKLKKPIIQIRSTQALLDLYREIHPAENILYLCDYEFIGNKQTGLDLIEMTGIARHSILVTSRWDEKEVRRRCEKIGLKILPKSMIGMIPIIKNNC